MSASDLYLSPDQQDLLMAALNSNQPSSAQRSSKPSKNGQRAESLSFTPGSNSDLTAPGSGRLDFSDDSPFLDFNGDGDFDETFAFEETGQMIGDLPDDEHSGGDLHDKRKSIDDKEDDDEGGGKRREGDDKTAKKPGRKPLTSEPTTKRKAQNRAAQRAFRERKEKHLQDLETKVKELEKDSEASTHENGLLKAQVERLTIELREYRKRLSWITSSSTRSQSMSSQPARNSMSGNDFQFEFPKFGDLPSTNYTSQNAGGARRSSERLSSPVKPAQVPAARHSVSSVGSQSGSVRNSPAATTFSTSPQPMNQYTADSLSGLFSPSILQASKANAQGYFAEQKPQASTTQSNSVVDTNYGPVPGLTSNSSISDSPASSSESHQHGSSNGTSPETLFNSPGPKQDYNLNAFGDNSHMPGTFGTQDFSTNFGTGENFDWLAQQNGGSFDPVLFGDYRETQDNILSQDFGSFFNEAYPLPELGSPLHNYTEAAAPGPILEQAAKSDLIKKVDAAKDGEEVVPADKGKMLSCNKIWDRLQSMEKFRNGEIDIDNLCSELRAKAKCSEGGAVVEEKHVNKLLGM